MRIPMIRTNIDLLPMIGVQGEVDPCMTPDGGEFNADNFRIGQDTVTMGGITYNFNIGDPCMGLRGEHLEPGVTSRNHSNPAANGAYNTYSCIGNTVKVVSGDAKGKTGFVTGKHGGPEHLMLYFDPETREQLTCDDKFLVKTWGFGLTLTDYPDILARNLDPELLNKMGIEEKDGKLIVPVTHKIPSCMMGSGKGYTPTVRGDYDIMTSDKEFVKKVGLDTLRYGDIVLLENQDNTYGRAHCGGAVSIGVIIHGDTYRPGHGPGVTILLTSRKPLIEGKIDKRANIAHWLGVKDLS